MFTLNMLKQNEKASLVKITDTDLEAKLLEHGFLENAEIKMIQSAISGDPFIVEGAFTRLIIRKKEAEKIIVKKIIEDLKSA